MNTSDFLNIVLTLGFIVIVSCIAFVSFYLVQVLKSVKDLADNLDDTTKDVQIIKNKIKMGVLTTLSAILTALVTGIIKRKRG